MPTLHWLTRDADLQTAGRVSYQLLGRVSSVPADPMLKGSLIYGTIQLS